MRHYSFPKTFEHTNSKNFEKTDVPFYLEETVGRIRPSKLSVILPKGSTIFLINDLKTNNVISFLFIYFSQKKKK